MTEEEFSQMDHVEPFADRRICRCSHIAGVHGDTGCEICGCGAFSEVIGIDEVLAFIHPCKE
jgi:hypothetical protein